jgi:hypothetical protein
MGDLVKTLDNMKEYFKRQKAENYPIINGSLMWIICLLLKKSHHQKAIQ